MADTKIFTGRRKSAVARVRVVAGTGTFRLNGRPLEDYFPVPTLQAQVTEPFRVTETEGRYSASVLVAGGGVSGQVGAIRHGVARALLRFDEELRPTLKTAKMLTRDPRAKERKKVGLKRARKAPQYTKR